MMQLVALKNCKRGSKRRRERGGRRGRRRGIEEDKCPHSTQVMVSVLIWMYLESLPHGRGWPPDYEGLYHVSLFYVTQCHTHTHTCTHIHSHTHTHTHSHSHTHSLSLKVALDVPEPRIHFALVCGAKSCPPIKTYSSTVSHAHQN